MRRAMHIRERGFSLLTVIFVILATAIAGTAVISLVSTSSQMVIDENRAQQAFDLAQAGISYTAQDLAGDNDWSDNMGSTVNFGAGFFTTTFQAQTATTAMVRSVGEVGGTTRVVEQGFSRGVSAAFEDAIYTEDNFKITGNSDATVEGSVTTGGTVDSTGNSNLTMSGPVTENDADASVPTPDWTYWKSAADQTILGNYSFTDGTHNGIYYISGKADIMNLSNFALNGTIISRGMVHISGNSNVTITAPGTNPAIVAEGKAQINNNSNVNILGWLFGLHQIHITSTSNFDCEGGIVAEDKIQCTGNSNFDVEYDIDRVPQIGFIGGEPGGGAGGDSVVFGDWVEEL